MKENWTKQMKQKLEGHKMAPPVGLWEDLSREMAIQSAPVVASKAPVSRRWYWAAAAAILAIVGFFAFYHVDEAQAPLTAAEPEAAHPNEPVLLAHVPVVNKVASTIVEPQSEMVEADLQKTVGEDSPQETAEEITLQETVEEITPQETEDDVNSIASAETKHTYLPEVVEPATVSLKADEVERWSLGLSGSNGLLAATNNLSTQMDMPPYYQSAPYTYLNGMDENKLVQAYTDNQMESKHKVPVRIGLSLQYQLTDNLALLSGISYSYLESEFISPVYSHRNYTQKLSYLGVPLGVSWKLWSSGGLGVYLTGGALLEKCIDSKVSQGEMNARPWQLSLNASAGAEYHFTRQLGVYLEPSLGYYFDDGSSLEHYYKEHPLAPSLQFGLRLHLK